MPVGQHDKDDYSFETFLFQMILGCIKWTVKAKGRALPLVSLTQSHITLNHKLLFPCPQALMLILQYKARCNF